MSFISDAWKDISGRTQRDAIKDATRQGIAYGEEANNLLTEMMGASNALFDPYRNLGLAGLDHAAILTDPNAQYGWLQNNPLFQLSLDNANSETSKMAAAKGRLSAGDTLMQLSNNTLLSAIPLLDRQQNNVKDMINTGFNASANNVNTNNMLSGRIADNLMQMGGFQSAGTIEAGNAQANVTKNSADALSNLLGLFF